MTNLNFCTRGMSEYEREESFKNGNVVPIGTVCFSSGSAFEEVEKVIVSEKNKEQVSMFWTSLFFLDRETAEYENAVARDEYGHYLSSL